MKRRLISTVLVVAVLCSMICIAPSASAVTPWEHFVEVLGQSALNFGQVDFSMSDFIFPITGECTEEDLLFAQDRYNSWLATTLRTGSMIGSAFDAFFNTHRAIIVEDTVNNRRRLQDGTSGEWIVDYSGKYPYVSITSNDTVPDWATKPAPDCPSAPEFSPKTENSWLELAPIQTKLNSGLLSGNTSYNYNQLTDLLNGLRDRSPTNSSGSGRACLFITPAAGKSIDILYAELVKGSSPQVVATKVTSVFDLSTLKSNTAAVQTDIPIHGYTVGGVRPTFPVRGDVWFGVTNGRVSTVQVYTGSAWTSSNARWWTGERWIPIYAFDIFTLEDCWDIADSDDVITPIESDTAGWNWWKKAWTDFRSWLGGVFGGGSGGGGSGGGDYTYPSVYPSAPVDNPSFEDDDGTKTTLWDFPGKLFSSLWGLLSGLVDVVAGGVGGLFTFIGDGIGGFFGAFSDNGGVFDFFTYEGGDIWD